MRPRPTIAVLLLLPACTASLPHQWTDRTFGFTVHSDFDPARTQLLFDDRLTQRLTALARLFAVQRLDDLQIFVHDEPTIGTGPFAGVAGWHDDGAIHLLARWGDGQLELPDSATGQRFLHELVHALHRRAGLQPPRWFEEGCCECLSASPIDSSGAIVLMPHADRERELRRLRGEGHWLDAAALLALRDRYPDAAPARSAMYAQGTSFAFFLLADGPLTRQRLEQLGMTADEPFAAHFAAWADGPAAAPVAELLTPFATHADANVRRAVAAQLGDPSADAAWWTSAGHLLADVDPEVRRTVRIRAVHRPDATPTNLDRFREWSRRDDPQLRLAGLIALAQCGDLAAAIAFADTIPGGLDGEWWQPMLWLVLLLPPQFVDPPLPDLDRSRQEPQYLPDYGHTVAAALTAARARLTWDPTAARWRPRS